MKVWELSELEWREIADLNLGWEVGLPLPLEALPLDDHTRRLLLPLAKHIFWDSAGKSIVVALNGRKGGRDLLRSIGEAQILIATLSGKTNQPLRLIWVFATPASPDGELWLRMLSEVSQHPIECLLRFDETFVFWKSGTKDPRHITRNPGHKHRISLRENRQPSTYQNLFGPQSSRILKYYILAGQLFESCGTLEIPRSINHLATLVGVPQSSASRTFAALEEQGFVYRKREKRALVPQITAGRRLLEAWWENERRRVLSGKANLSCFVDPAPLADSERQEYLEKDVLTFLSQERLDFPKSSPRFGLGGQMALRLLGLSVSSEDACVIHSHHGASQLIVDRMGLIPCTSRTRGALVIHRDENPNPIFRALQLTSKGTLWTADPLTLFLDTVLSPQRAAEQCEFLFDKVFAPLFEQRGWRL